MHDEGEGEVASNALGSVSAGPVLVLVLCRACLHSYCCCGWCHECSRCNCSLVFGCGCCR